MPEKPVSAPSPAKRVPASRIRKWIGVVVATVLVTFTGVALNMLVSDQSGPSPTAVPILTPTVSPSSENTDAVLSIQRSAEGGSINHECTAALVAPQWAVTTAHCVTPPPPSEEKAKADHRADVCRNVDFAKRPADPKTLPSAPMTVRGGTKNFLEGGETAVIDAVHPLPGWSWTRREGPLRDLAVIHLDRPMSATPFAIASSPLPEGRLATTAGWATWPDRCGGIVPAMQQWDVTVTTCPTADDELSCVTTGGDLGPCEGASGGPLYTTAADGTQHVIGVYSRAVRAEYCGRRDPKYTLLSRHMDFVSSTIGR